MKRVVSHLLARASQLKGLSTAEEEQGKAENHPGIEEFLFSVLGPFAFTSLLMSQPKTFSLMHFISHSSHTGPKRSV